MIQATNLNKISLGICKRYLIQTFETNRDEDIKLYSELNIFEYNSDTLQKFQMITTFKKGNCISFEIQIDTSDEDLQTAFIDSFDEILPLLSKFVDSIVYSDLLDLDTDIEKLIIQYEQKKVVINVTCF